MTTKTPSKLEKILREGHLAVTSECGPPRGSNPEHIIKKGELIKDHVDAINITDNQTSVCRTCSLAVCIRLKTMGLEPVLQMVTRDRNRIALQSDILGAAHWDINNILCLSGDHQSFGDCSKGQNVHDLDSMQLLQTVRLMRDEGKFLGGDDIKRPPQMFAGAAANPFADPFEYRVIRLAKKIDAGVDFIQTQCIYNMDRFKEWMKMARDEGLTEKVYIMAGVTPLKSAGMANYMATKVAGMDIPEPVLKRIAGVSKDNASKEGIAMCVETIAELREIEGVHGVHIMAIEWEEKVGEIVKAAGLLPRPEQS